MIEMNAQAGALLDPSVITLPPSLHFRAPQSMAGAGFQALKSSIAHAGGNVQPIKVIGQDGNPHVLVFGTRRLQACRELGLPVRAVVDSTPLQRLVVELDMSNDDTQVSVYERGCLYDSALQAGYFPSRRRLAEAVGRPLSEVAAAVVVAQLPRQLLNRLRDPRTIRVGVAKKLAALLESDPAGFEARLSALNTAVDLRDDAFLKALLR